MDDLFAIGTSLVWDLVGVILPVAMPLVLVYVRRRIDRALDAFEAATHIEIEARHRAALHEAAETVAVQIWRARTATAGGRLRPAGPTVAEDVAQNVAQVHESVPDAIAALGASDEVIGRIVMRKFQGLRS